MFKVTCTSVTGNVYHESFVHANTANDYADSMRKMGYAVEQFIG